MVIVGFTESISIYGKKEASLSIAHIIYISNGQIPHVLFTHHCHLFI